VRQHHRYKHPRLSRATHLYPVPHSQGSQQPTMAVPEASKRIAEAQKLAKAEPTKAENICTHASRWAHSIDTDPVRQI
jgi:hypothetical protein